MKKILLAASLVALMPLLFSCGKVENNSETKFEEPRFIQFAGQLILRGGAAASSVPVASVSSTPAVSAISVIQSIEFTESGLYAIGSLVSGGLEFKTGTYTVNGSVYTLSGFGTVEINGTSNPVDVTITPNGGGAALNMKADLKKASGTNTAYRGWTIDKTRVTVNGFHAPISADFNGCNFQEMAKFLDDNGHKGVYLPSGSMKSVSITGADSIIFAYSDDSADVAECKLNGSNLSFSWRGKSRLFEVENGKATIEYLDGKCILKIDASLKGSTTSGSVTFVLSPMQ